MMTTTTMDMMMTPTRMRDMTMMAMMIEWRNLTRAPRMCAHTPPPSHTHVRAKTRRRPRTRPRRCSGASPPG